MAGQQANKHNLSTLETPSSQHAQLKDRDPENKQPETLNTLNLENAKFFKPGSPRKPDAGTAKCSTSSMCVWMTAGAVVLLEWGLRMF